MSLPATAAEDAQAFGKAVPSHIADFLAVPTPDAWVEWAVTQIDTLLIDHANCEKKAASTALAML
ncbi:MAG: tRNA isopentenyl-2-thiomethyl-A-37 hydroxylase MiaE, partial [Pseudomonadota bacterium]